jgi:hypothetical protein
MSTLLEHLLRHAMYGRPYPAYASLAGLGSILILIVLLAEQEVVRQALGFASARVYMRVLRVGMFPLLVLVGVVIAKRALDLLLRASN